MADAVVEVLRASDEVLLTGAEVDCNEATTTGAIGAEVVCMDSTTGCVAGVEIALVTIKEALDDET